MNLLEIKKEYLTAEEAANIIGITPQGVNKSKYKYDYKTVKSRGKTGYKILFKTESVINKLPADKKLELLKQTPEYAVEKFKPEEEPDNWNELPERAREVALAKFDLICLWRTFREGFKPLSDADEIFITKYRNKEFPEIYKKLNGKGSVGTLYRDSKKLDENNNDYKVLAPGYAFGKKGPVISGKEAEALLKYIKYPTKLKIAEIVRWGMKELKDDGMLNVRSADTYRRWVEEWKNKNFDQWIFFREGGKAIDDQVLFFTRRDKRLVNVADLMVIDGHVGNLEIVSPYPPYKPKRMTYIVVYDYYSDMPLGVEIMPTENKFAIASAVRRALLFLGYACGYENMALKGRIVNIDNGRANKSKYLLGERTKKSGWFKGDLNQQGIVGLFEKVFEGVSIAKPYHGQTKTVERFFGTMSEHERLTFTYSGTSIADKPARMLRNEKYHKAVYEKLLANVALTIDQAHFLLAKWFDEYSNRPHTSGYFKGRTPKEVFFENLNKLKSMPDFESRLISKEKLNYLMLEETITTLYRRGIRLFGNEYFHPLFHSIEKGSGKVSFRVKYDRDNTDSVLVFDDKGTFLCEATQNKHLHPLAEFYGTPEQIQEMQNQVGMQTQLKQLTVASFQDHFKHAIMPELPGTTQKLVEKETAKLEKRGKLSKKISTADMDLKCIYASDSQEDNDIDLKIAEGM